MEEINGKRRNQRNEIEWKQRKIILEKSEEKL